MQMFLIRHGESMQNTKENYEVGLPDHKVYLSEKGKIQAHDTGIFLRDYVKLQKIDLSKATLWVSPYTRTRETASILNEELGVKNVKEDITLIEQRYGLFSDKDIETIKKLYPQEFACYDNFWRNDGRFYAKLPQGESPYDVALRTKQFIDTIFRDDSDPLFIVSHGTTIKTIIMNWFHHSPEWFNAELNPDNCSVRLITSKNRESTDEYIYKGPVKRLKK